MSADYVRQLRVFITINTSTSYNESGKLPLSELILIADDTLFFLEEMNKPKK